MIKTVWTGFEDDGSNRTVCNGKRMLNAKRIGLATVADVKKYIVDNSKCRHDRVEVFLEDGYLLDDDERVLELDCDSVVHIVYGGRYTHSFSDSRYVSCTFIDTYVDRRNSHSDDYALGKRHPSRDANSDIHHNNIHIDSHINKEISRIELDDNNNNKRKINDKGIIEDNKGKVDHKTIDNKGRVDDKAVDNAIVADRKKSSHTIDNVKGGDKLDSSVQKKDRYDGVINNNSKTIASFMNKQPTESDNIDIDIIKQIDNKKNTLMNKANSNKQPSVNNKPTTISTRNINNNKKRVIQSSSDESSDDDDSSIVINSKVQKTNINSTMHRQLDTNNKISLDLSKLNSNNRYKDYIKVCIDTIKELGDNDINRLFNKENMSIYYKYMEMDEDTCELSLSKDYIHAIVRRCTNRIISLDNMVDGRVESSDDIHIDVFYDMMIHTSYVPADLYDAISLVSKDDEDMVVHKDKYKQMVSIDDQMSEAEMKISHQVNYYFGDKNYFTDKYILNHIQHDSDNAFSIDLLLNFNIIKNTTRDMGIIREALKKFEPSSMCTYKLIDTTSGLKIQKKTITV